MLCHLNGGQAINATCNESGCVCPPNDQMIVDDNSSGGTGGNVIMVNPEDTYSCLPGEETVMRSTFKIGCAKDVHDPQWH